MANFELILLALIAVFIFLRLRSVLGSRDGNEENRNHYDSFKQESEQSEVNEAPADNVIPLPNSQKPAEPAAPTQKKASDVKLVPLSAPVQKGLEDIAAHDESFEAGSFADGAAVAFEMILTAFASDDRDMLKSLLTPEVYGNFEHALEARTAAGETFESTLIGIQSMEVLEASFEGSVAEITLRIISEQVNVTKDAEGAIVDGDSNYIDTISDVWTFMRDVSSGAPNWYLEATQSE